MLWQSEVPVNCTNEFHKCLKQLCIIITLNPMVLYILVPFGTLVGELWIETEFFFFIFSFAPRKFRAISIWHNLIFTNSSFINDTVFNYVQWNLSILAVFGSFQIRPNYTSGQLLETTMNIVNVEMCTIFCAKVLLWCVERWIREQLCKPVNA